MDMAREETDPTRRKELFAKIDNLLSEEGPSIISFFQKIFALKSKGVKGFQLTRNWINDYRSIEV